MASPDKISVKVSVLRDLYATGVHMYVKIEGGAVYSGKQALNKAREVKNLVTALGKKNIEEKNIKFRGVSSKVSSGVISKSSSAVYKLLIEVSELNILAEIIGVIMSQKNAKISRLDWQYGEREEIYDEMLREGLKRAEERASIICNSLSLKKLGVHNLSEKNFTHDTIFDERQYGLVAYESESRAEMTNEDLGLEINNSIGFRMELGVDYLVAPLAD